MISHKKKRLNVRALIFLGSVVALIVVVASLIVLHPETSAQQHVANARAAEAAGDMPTATREWNLAIRNCLDNKQRAAYRVDYAKFCDSRLKKESGLTPEVRDALLMTRIDQLRKAIVEDTTQIAAFQILTDLYWPVVRHRTWNAGREHTLKEYLELTDSLLKLNPEKPAELHYRSAVAYIQLVRIDPGLTSHAIEHLRKAVTLAPDNRHYFRELIGIMPEDGDSAERQNIYIAAMDNNPEVAWPLVEYASFLLRSGEDIQKILGYLKKAVEVEPSCGEGYSATGQLYILQKEYAKARTILEEGLSRDPAFAALYLHMSQLERVDSEWQKAVDILQQGLKQQEMCEAEEFTKLQNRANFYNWLTDVYLDSFALARREGLGDKSLKEVKALSAKIEEIMPAGELSYLVKGRIAVLENNYTLARTALEESRELGRGIVIDRASSLAFTYIKLGMLTRGEAEVDRILKIPGQMSNIPVLLIKADVCIQSAEYDMAEKVIEHVLTLDKQNQAALSMRKALEIANGSDDMSDSDGSIWVSRMVQIRARNDIDAGYGKQAEKLMADYLKSNPDDIMVLQLMANYLLANKRNSDARKYIDAAMAASPDTPGIIYMSNLLSEDDPERRFQIEMDFIKTLPDSAVAKIAEYQLCLRYKKHKQAEELLMSAVREFPGHTELAWTQFRNALARNDLDQAQGVIDRMATEIDTRKRMMARLALARKDFSAAAGQFKDILYQKPHLLEDRLLLGR